MLGGVLGLQKNCEHSTESSHIPLLTSSITRVPLSQWMIHCMHVYMLRCVWLFASSWTVVPRFLYPWDSPGKNTWIAISSPGDFPNPGIELESPALAGGVFTTELPGKPEWSNIHTLLWTKVHIPDFLVLPNVLSCPRIPSRIPRAIESCLFQLLLAMAVLPALFFQPALSYFSRDAISHFW